VMDGDDHLFHEIVPVTAVSTENGRILARSVANDG
jgi:hypothetical protein